MKMKVRVDKLQAAIHKHVEQDKRRFERESIAYRLATIKARARHIQNVVDYLKHLRAGGEVWDTYSNRERLSDGCKWPAEVKKAETHTDLLVKLDLVEDQILVVDDHSDYMKFLSGKCVC